MENYAVLDLADFSIREINSQSLDILKSAYEQDPTKLVLEIEEVYTELITNYNLQYYTTTLEHDSQLGKVVKTYKISYRPDWEGFNLAILSNADFQSVSQTVDSIVKGLVSALIIALNNLMLGIITPGQFAVYYNQFISLGGVPQETKLSWRELAEYYHIPTEVLEVIA